MAPRADLQPGTGRYSQAGSQAARDDGAGGNDPVPHSLTEFAPAKVNLFLHVTGRRADGYHTLDSLAVFPPVGDVLRASTADALSLRIEGRFAAALSADADNLILRAARLLGPADGARIELIKNLPVASGIGGGSADAAAALRLLGQLWGSTRNLSELAQELGADVPVCLARRAVRMRGIGERLDSAPHLPPGAILLVNPGVPVATADVFRARESDGFSAEAGLPDGWSDVAAMAEHLAACRNDLEVPAISLCPAIGTALSAIRRTRGCLLARMSGSGATCFGLFGTDTQADEAARAVMRCGWWTWSGPINS